MPEAYRLGRRNNNYYNTGSYGSPVWVRVTRVRDLTVDSTLETVDASDKDTDYNVDVPVALVKTITATLTRSSDSTSYLALEAAHDAMTPLDMIFLNGPVTTPGSRGLRASVAVTKFSEVHPVKEVQTIDLEFKPAPSDNPPTRFVAT